MIASCILEVEQPMLRLSNEKGQIKASVYKKENDGSFTFLEDWFVEKKELVSLKNAFNEAVAEA